MEIVRKEQFFKKEISEKFEKASGLHASRCFIRSEAETFTDDSPRLFLSWQDARKTATFWLADSGFPKRCEIKGATIDLMPHLENLKAEGEYRRMVIEAAVRILTSRGADAVIAPPSER